MPLARIALCIRAQSKYLPNANDQLKNPFKLLACTKWIIQALSQCIRFQKQPNASSKWTAYGLLQNQRACPSGIRPLPTPILVRQRPSLFLSPGTLIPKLADPTFPRLHNLDASGIALAIPPVNLVRQVRGQIDGIIQERSTSQEARIGFRCSGDIAGG